MNIWNVLGIVWIGMLELIFLYFAQNWTWLPHFQLTFICILVGGCGGLVVGILLIADRIEDTKVKSSVRRE